MKKHKENVYSIAEAQCRLAVIIIIDLTATLHTLHVSHYSQQPHASDMENQLTETRFSSILVISHSLVILLISSLPFLAILFCTLPRYGILKF